MSQNFNNKILEEKLRRDKKNKTFLSIFIIICLLALSILLYKKYLKNSLYDYKSQKNILQSKVANENQGQNILDDTNKNLESDNQKSNNDIKEQNNSMNQNKNKEEAFTIDNSESPKAEDKTTKINIDSYCQEYLINEECNIDNLFIKLTDNYNNIFKSDSTKKSATDLYPNVMSDIEKNKNESLNYYSLNNKELALIKIIEVNNKSKILIKDLDSLFFTELENANKHFNNLNYDEAIKSISIAYNIQPKNKDVLFLKNRIAVLPDLKHLLKDLKKIKAEGRIKEEIIILKKILKLDSNYKKNEERLILLENIIKEQEYASYIVESYKYIEERDYNNSDIQAQKALNLKPEGIELKELFIKILNLKQELDFAENLRNANYSMQEDDWESSLKYFMKAFSIDQRSLITQQGIELSKKIIKLKKEIESFINNSKRLTSNNVREEASLILESSNLISENSPSLKEIEMELSSIISLYEIPIEIEIISDGESEISVRGEGEVGKVFKKNIFLKPGIYKFEAKKVGYKTKLIRVEILIGQIIKSIEVICDEPI